MRNNSKTFLKLFYQVNQKKISMKTSFLFYKADFKKDD
ncbi:hypothetical protein SPONN_1669 [uncultured Candidatus Thioglobus sp.]|nr:hypothetical protein SPONN_1669 [uncultured Candidatus Thioglobus sp.]